MAEYGGTPRVPRIRTSAGGFTGWRGQPEQLGGLGGTRGATAWPGSPERAGGLGGTRGATAWPGSPERAGGLGGHFGAPHLNRPAE
jgi:hypothetical protein